MNKNKFQALLREAEESSELAVEEAKIDFALELAKLLERSGMSRSDLSARLGVSLPMVTKILRGDTNLTIESMVKATRAAQGVLHLNIAPMGSQGRWFEVVRNAAPNRTAVPGSVCETGKGKAMNWRPEGEHAIESIAA